MHKLAQAGQQQLTKRVVMSSVAPNPCEVKQMKRSKDVLTKINTQEKRDCGIKFRIEEDKILKDFEKLKKTQLIHLRDDIQGASAPLSARDVSQLLDAGKQTDQNSKSFHGHPAHPLSIHLTTDKCQGFSTAGVPVKVDPYKDVKSKLFDYEKKRGVSIREFKRPSSDSVDNVLKKYAADTERRLSQERKSSVFRSRLSTEGGSHHSAGSQHSVAMRHLAGSQHGKMYPNKQGSGSSIISLEHRPSHSKQRASYAYKTDPNFPGYKPGLGSKIDLPDIKRHSQRRRSQDVHRKPSGPSARSLSSVSSTKSQTRPGNDSKVSLRGIESIDLLEDSEGEIKSASIQSLPGGQGKITSPSTTENVTDSAKKKRKKQRQQSLKGKEEELQELYILVRKSLTSLEGGGNREKLTLPKTQIQLDKMAKLESICKEIEKVKQQQQESVQKEFDPLEVLNTRYLRLTDSNKASLIQMCKDRGIDIYKDSTVDLGALSDYNIFDKVDEAQKEYRAT